jgi:hypothetical protein
MKLHIQPMHGAHGLELQRLGVTVRSDAAIYSLEICRLALPTTLQLIALSRKGLAEAQGK